MKMSVTKPGKRLTITTVAAAALAAAGITTGTLIGGASGHPAHRADLDASSCGGPAGAAYVTDPGYQGFTAVDTADCDVIQTYNVDDLQVPGDSGDYNYDGTAEGIALHGSTLWFGVTGTSEVASIDTSSLNPDDYNPPETLVPVGLNPTMLAVTPDGSQVWVADSGPQTSTSPVSGVAVIDTSEDRVVANLQVPGDPSDVAFSPSGARAYVTTSDGLFVYDTVTRRLVAAVRGLGDPESVTVSADGLSLYVTETSAGELATLSTATYRVVRTTRVGQLPWQAALSPDGSTVYVANPDSDTVSAVDTADGRVTHTYDVAGDPDAVAVTPDGSQLWVGDNTSGSLTVIDLSSGATAGQIDLGGEGPNSGDGLEPTGVVLTTTPTAGS